MSPALVLATAIALDERVRRVQSMPAMPSDLSSARRLDPDSLHPKLA